MRPVLVILMAALMAITGTAGAQTPAPASTPAPAASAGATATAGASTTAAPAATVGTNATAGQQQNPLLFPLPTATDVFDFAHFLNRYYGVVTQADYAKIAEEGARDTFTRVDQEHENITLDVNVLMGEFGPLFPEFQGAFQAEGQKVPTATRTAFEAHVKRNGCELTGTKMLGGYEVKTWSPGCETQFGQLKAIFDAKLPKAKRGPYTDNAQHRMQEAENYEGLDAIALAYYALLGINSQLPAAEQLWPLASWLIGKEVCAYQREADEACGKIEKIEQDGITIGGTKVPFDKLVSVCFDQEACKAMGGGSFNDGFVVTGEVGWTTMLFNPELTTTHMFNAGVALQFNLEGLPIAFRASGGVLGAGGGLATHYTEADKLWTGYFTLGVGYVPMFTKHVGLSLMPKGVITTSGGGGAVLDAGPTIYLGENNSILIAPQASFGYMTLNKPLGGNDTSPLPDPNAQGFTTGLGIMVGGRF